MAYGILDIRPWEFWDKTSPGEIVKMYEAKRWADKNGHNDGLLLTVLRWVGWMIYATTSEKNKKSPEQLFRYEWEKPKKKSKEQLLKEKEKILNHDGY